jgi:hypothetical protein
MIKNQILQIFKILLIFSIMFGCKSKVFKAENVDKVRIDSLENEMRLATEKNPSEPDLKLAMYLAQAYQNFEIRYPTDSASPKYLFKSGQVIENVFDDKGRAAEIYYSVYKKYPNSKAAPFALFMTGNLFHTVKDTVHAIEMLDFFMAKYPDHQLKNDAASLIQSLGAVPDSTSRPVKVLPMNPL